MSKKRNKSVKPKPLRKKSYAQRHPQAKKGLPPVKLEGDDVPKIIMIIILIIFIVALLVYLIRGGQPGYDWYPNRHRYR